jgi:hypothetical protein
MSSVPSRASVPSHAPGAVAAPSSAADAPSVSNVAVPMDTGESPPQGLPASHGGGSAAGPLRRRQQQAEPLSESGDPDAYASAKVEAEAILRTEGALPFDDRSFLGQLLGYESKADALDDLVRNWYDPISASRVRKALNDLKSKQVKVAAYAIGARVFGTVERTREAIRDVVSAYHEDARRARRAASAEADERAVAASESAEDDTRSPGPSPRRRTRETSPRTPPPKPRAPPAALQLLQKIPIIDDRPASGKARSGRALSLAAPPRRRSSGVFSPQPLPLLSPDDSPSEPDVSDRDEDGPFHPRADRISRSELRHNMAVAGVPKRMFPGFIANAKAASGGRSLYDLYKFEVTPRFKDGSSHSKQECLALSRIIDALLADDKEGALELACRRLGGVHTAVETGNWDMCERLENESEQRSFVPAEFMSSALQSVIRMQRIKASNAPGGGVWGSPSVSGRTKPKSKSASGGVLNSNTSSSSHKKKTKELSRSQKKEGSSQQ